MASRPKGIPVLLGFPMLSGRRALAGLAAMAAIGVAVRRLGRRSGATDALRAQLPGDELVPAADVRSRTRAESRPSPADPAAIWPWIAQMGYPAHRGPGGTRPTRSTACSGGSASPAPTEIRPDLQQLEGRRQGAGQHRLVGLLHGRADRVRARARPPLDPPPAHADARDRLQLGVRPRDPSTLTRRVSSCAHGARCEPRYPLDASRPADRGSGTS